MQNETLEQILSKDLVEKSFLDAETNELAKMIGFMDLIQISINILFIEMKNAQKNFEIWKNQQINLEFESTNFKTEFTILELKSNFKADTLRTKIPINSVLKKLQGTKTQYTYKSVKYSDFELNIEFYFKKHKEVFYPITIYTYFSNIPEDEEYRKSLISEITYNIVNDIKQTKNIPPNLLNIISSKFRQSGHYVDLKLQHNFDNKNNLEETVTKDKIKALIHNEIKVSGIRLNSGDDRVLNSIMKLLHMKSDKNELSDNYYKGNMPSQRIKYGEVITDFPVLKFRPAELYKEYKGEQDYSGAEALYIKQLLLSLQEKKFLIIYKRHRVNDKGEKVVDRIEEYQPLVRVLTYYEGISLEEDSKLETTEEESLEIANKRGEIIIVLNPILTDQIDTKFIEYPTDINKRTVIASGGARKVTEANIRIRDYLLREISNKRFISEVNEDKLHHILGLEGYIREGKKKKINDITKNAIRFSQDIGISKKIEFVTGAKGQGKYKFFLNPDF